VLTSKQRLRLYHRYLMTLCGWLVVVVLMKLLSSVLQHIFPTIADQIDFWDSGVSGLWALGLLKIFPEHKERAKHAAMKDANEEDFQKLQALLLETGMSKNSLPVSPSRAFVWGLISIRWIL